MKLLKMLSVFCLVFLLASCSNTTRIYYWAKDNTGSDRFAQDHLKCLEKADFFPWTLFNPLPLVSDVRNLTLNLKDGGIWGNFSPYPGAIPVFINTNSPSSTVIYWRYAMCMRGLGYKERRPYGGPL